MGRALKAAPRDIVLSICTGARLAHIEAYKTWAQMWRGTGDTHDSWANIVNNGFLADDSNQEDWRPHTGPGGWHDLDMLSLGPNCMRQRTIGPNLLKPDEQIAHMTAWALYPSPLILSCDLTALSDFELRLFANEEVLAVNQDRLAKPAIRLREERRQSPGTHQPHRNSRIWARPLADGSFAVAFFNFAGTADEISLDFEDLGLAGGMAVRNLWERRDLGRCRQRFAIPVPAHGAQLLRVAPV